MNYRKGLCVSLLSTLVALPAFADRGNLYFAGKIGASFEDLDSVKNTNPYYPDSLSSNTANETVLAYGGAIGYRWNHFFIPIRWEVDYTYRNNLNYNTDASVNIDSMIEEFVLKSTVQNQTILGNVYFDVPLTDYFAFFIGGGGGLGYNTTHNKLYLVATGQAGAESTTDRTEAVWMATAGITLIPVDWMALDLSYRYSDLGAVRWSTYDDIELTSHKFSTQEAFLSIRFTVPSEPQAKAEPLPYRPKAEPVPEAEPVKMKPRTKAPSYKNKAPEYHPTKGPAYEPAPKKSATYNPERAKPVSRSSSVN